jgi:hypothetical protein
LTALGAEVTSIVMIFSLTVFWQSRRTNFL